MIKEKPLSRVSGFLFAFGAALALSASFIFSKSVLNHVSILQFGAAWFSIGVVWNATWYFGRGLHKQFKSGTRKRLLVVFLIAILEGAATGLFYMAIRAMENPAVVSFIGNIGPVFVTVMGILILKERFNGAQMLGIAITIVGVFTMNFRNGAFSGFLDPGAIFVISASLLFALATISARHFKDHLDPELMSLVRTFLLAIVFIFLLVYSGESVKFTIKLWRNIALGSMLETFLTIVFAYQALRRIEATATSLIISSKAVWTFALAWMFLNVFPTNVQLVGGIFTIAGIYLITLSRRSQNPK